MPILNRVERNVIHGMLEPNDSPIGLSFATFRRGRPLLSEVFFDDDPQSFRIVFQDHVSLSDGPSIIVKFCGTDLPVPISEDLRGFVNDFDETAIASRSLLENPLFLGPIMHPLPERDVPQDMIDYVAGGGTQESYRRVGYENALDILKFGVVTSSGDKVTELGCGCGRVGVQIISMLDPDKGGAYLGFDIWGKGIDWATENITRFRPYAKFASVANRSAYNAAVSGRLNVADSSQDSFIATSVFTHLRYPAALAYTKEVARILKPGGKGYITFFASKDHFRHINPDDTSEEDEYAINYVNVQAEDTFADEAAVRLMFADCGLIVLGVKYGTWRGNIYLHNPMWRYQDVFIVKKPT